MKVTARRAKITVSADGAGTVSQGGALLLTQALRVTGLDRGLMVALERWRASRAVHDPGKIIAGTQRPPPRLRLAATWPWAGQLTAAITRLQAFAPG